MPVHIALLRGINVGGHNMVPMVELRSIASGLGFSSVQTVLQSGNLIFQSEVLPAPKLEHVLECETERRLGLKIDFFVRTLPEFDAVINGNPFRTQADTDPGRLIAMFTKCAPEPTSVKTLKADLTGPEMLRVVEGQLYITYPEGQGNSKLTNALIERKLGTRGTARNWNTVLKLATLART